MASSGISLTFDNEQKAFVVTEADNNTSLLVKIKIKLEGVANDKVKSVNTGLNINDYTYCRLINPFLHAQGDVFKIKIKKEKSEISVGYIFPASALEGDEEDIDENFDEAKQAYKFYCAKKIISNHKYAEAEDGININLSEIIDKDSCYVIIFNPLLKDEKFKINDIFPSLALYGYNNYPATSKSNLANLLSSGNDPEKLEEVVKVRFHQYRSQQSLLCKVSRNIVSKSTLIKLLYERFLVEADNPLYRFLILYQIIEYLVEVSFHNGLESLIKEKETYSNYKFIQQINELNNTRSTINKLFAEVTFDEKDEITNVLKSFILIFDSDYNKQATGDCLYDIRNILLHDYKSVLERNHDGSLVALIIQCEILIHHLVIKLGVVVEIAAVPLDPVLKNKKVMPRRKKRAFSKNRT